MAQFGVFKAHGKINELDDSNFMTISVGEAFSKLKSQTLLSQKDITDRNITLRIFVAEVSSLPKFLMFFRLC